MPSSAAPAPQAWKWLLAPYYLARLFGAAKSFDANPLLGSPRLNAMGLHRARVSAAYAVAQARRKKLGKLVSAEDRAAFERDGYVVKRNFLPQPVFDALVAEIKAHRGVIEERAWGETINRKLLVDREVTAKIPALKPLLNSPQWRHLLDYVGGCSSTPLVYIQSLYRRGGAVDPQTRLHCDTFHPTTKAWLFLTDVRENEGAFTYVPGSHRLTEKKLAWQFETSLDARDSDDRETREGSFRVDPAELAALGFPPPAQLAVPANTLVAADTSGFHARGPSVAGTLRVEIWALGRRQPFLSWGGLEPWSSEDLGTMVTTLQRLRDRLQMKSRHWAYREGVSAFDFGEPAGGTARPR